MGLEWDFKMPDKQKSTYKLTNQYKYTKKEFERVDFLIGEIVGNPNCDRAKCNKELNQITKTAQLRADRKAKKDTK